MKPILPFVVAASVTLGAWAESPRDLYSDTWVAIDGLGRSVDPAPTANPAHSDRKVGIFYFLWLGPHGYGGPKGPNDMRPDQGVAPKTEKSYGSPRNLSEILATEPGAPLLGDYSEFHHWGEPEMGYYLSDDPYVIHKHVEMLADAGVDFLYLDVTNGFHYKGVYEVLLTELQRMKARGAQVPEVTFITNSSAATVASFLWEDIYAKGRYADLWFRWEGKPLLLSSPEGVPEKTRDFFTWRQSWAWSTGAGAAWFGDGRDKWPWLDNYPQNYGWHRSPREPEQISVSVAQHSTTNIGRSFHNRAQPEPAAQRPAEGLFFEEQWRRALQVAAPVTMITGWNEWVAQRLPADGTLAMLGSVVPKGGSIFVDAYNAEYSRDIEPMKGGFTDNYYYQMVAHIRQLKGTRPIPPAGPVKTIRIDGNFADWANVTPEYRDHAFDTMHRDHPGWGKIEKYVNKTGRNDIIAAKVSRDAQNIYFMATARDPLTPRTDRNWMLLFIDADRDHRTGWEGYDYVVNAPTLSNTVSTVKKAVIAPDGTVTWKPVAQIPFRTAVKQLELAIPAALLGWSEDENGGLDFKWADNIQKANDITEFSISGDAAPSRRFNYRYAIKP